ncbi:MAG: hypothetical protein AAGI08_11245, partial [Bacteroidota bacterium]
MLGRRVLSKLLVGWVLVAAHADSAEAQAAVQAEDTQRIENLAAFAQAYGAVRFFHPSDEAASTNWDQFAILGAQRVMDAGSQAELKLALEALIHPIAPSVDVYAAGTEPKAVPVPEDTAGLTLVTWQHRGVLLESAQNIYGSVRLNRPAPMADADGTLAEPLFEARAKAGEVALLDLGQGLRLSVPLTLYSRDAQTLPVPNLNALEALNAELDDVASTEERYTDSARRAADVIVAWSIFEHFYPYPDAITGSWDDVLGEALAGALQATSANEHCEVLHGLVARLNDGHGNVFCAGLPRRARLPFAVELVEGQVTVVASSDTSAARLGDLVISVDGVAAETLFEREAELASGSEHWRRYRASQAFGSGPEGSQAQIMLDRDGKRVAVQVGRVERAPAERRPAPIAEVEPGIMYVDIERITDSLFVARTEDLAAARGVVFDFRGYPGRMTPNFINFLTESPVVSTWYEIPQTIRPEAVAGAGADSVRWSNMQPAEPHIGG